MLNITTCFFLGVRVMEIFYLNLELVGFRADIPQKEAGTLTLPPISLPIPKREPPAPIRQASPPEEPPGVRSLLHGFVVIPQTGLLQPKLKKFPDIKFQVLGSVTQRTNLNKDCGTFVLQNGMAPRLLNAATRAASSLAGSLRFLESPAVLE